MMKRILAIGGASALTLGVLVDCVEARPRSFEVGGRRYPYETSNSQQVAAARKLIDAANAADAAKAKADVENTANPLVRILGSQTQREATEAQARLDQAIAAHEQASAPVQRQSVRQVTTGGELRRTEADEQVRRGAGATAERQGPSSKSEQVHPKPKVSNEVGSDLGTSVKPRRSPDAAQPAVKSVFLDPASGIKTTFMRDGSIHEEPIDTTKPATVPDRGDASTSTGSIDRIR